MSLDDATRASGWWVEVCSADDRRSIEDLLKRTMYIDEPITSTLDDSLMIEVKNNTAHLDIVLQGHSFKAIDPAGKILGVVLNIACPYAIEDYEPIPKVIDFINHVERAMKLDCSGLLDMYMLAVDPDCRRWGIAKALGQKTLTHAVACGFQGMKITASSVYTANLAKSLGFMTHYSIAYKDYKDENGEIVFNTPHPHTHLSVMLKRFNESSPQKDE